MTYKDYKDNMKLIQIMTLRFLESEKDIEENYENLIKLFKDKQILENKHEIKSVLYLISKISDNHHREDVFINKIEKILRFFSNEIAQFFTNTEIFTIFQKNKRILLSLIKSKIFYIDEVIINIFSKDKYNEYMEFFSPEIKIFVDEINNEDDDNQVEYKIPKDFEENRKIGENEDYLCQLIRKDLIDEFKLYVYRYGVSLDQTIKPSIYETNSFLIENKKDTTLIEYAAFFGSTQIFNYLYLNKVDFTPRIWLYAIHSNKIQLIYFAEENGFFNEMVSYESCFKEAVKCHHIEIANFFQYNYLDQKEIKNKALNNYDENIYSYAFHYYNFMFFPDNINNNFFIYYACEYDYFIIVKFLLETKNIDLCLKIQIQNCFFFKQNYNKKIFFK